MPGTRWLTAIAGALMASLAALAARPLEAQTPIGPANRPSDAARASDGTKAGANAAESINAFGNDLFAKLMAKTGEHGNLFFSPYSISSALTMTRIGAHGLTGDEMSATLHLPADLAAVEASYKSLNALLAGGGPNAGLTIDIGNALWAQKDEPIVPDYLTVVKTDFDSELIPLDFAAQPEPSRIQINDWVAKKTQDKIKDLLAPGSITPDTKLVLTNAIYFKAAWEHAFAAAHTAKGDFHGYAQVAIRADLMHQTEHFPYAEDDICQMIRLPYRDAPANANDPLRFVAMEILLPKPDTTIDSVRKGDEIPAEQGMTRLESALQAGELANLTHQLADREVRLTLPKWQASQEFSLGSTLQKMGMHRAFGQDADFTGISEKGGLMLSDVVHKAFINVDEAGTEAAAATGVVMQHLAMRPPAKAVDFLADHPFIYVIIDNQTGAILFVGRLTDPRAEQ